MTFWEALILGLVQGITEFLPISSSAHVIIMAHLMGLELPGLAVEVALHLASVLAVIVYFHRDLIRLTLGSLRYLFRKEYEHRHEFYFSLYMIVATVITGVIGLAVEKSMGDSLRSPVLIGFSLLVTGVFLVLIERFHRMGERREEHMRMTDAVIIGLGQALAVIPGISRAGSTLIVALYRGLDKDTAVRFSFLLAIPVILGTSVLALRDWQAGIFHEIGLAPLAFAFVVTFFASLAGIVWLIAFLKQSRLIYFAIYCLLAGAFCLAVL